MKYGESLFDICYLVFAIGTGIMLFLSKNKETRMMALASLILGIGDSFHLVPRVCNYFITGNWQVYLGLGKLVTSITMTLFYLCLYRLWLIHYNQEEKMDITKEINIMVLTRILLCLAPQNGWIDGRDSLFWAILRNIPFLVLGMRVAYLYYQQRKGSIFSSMWVLIVLSFGFYLPVALGASYIPMLGMLMLPKTICYIGMLILFIRRAREI